MLVGDPPVPLEHASMLGLARQIGTTSRTMWRSLESLLQVMVAVQGGRGGSRG
jgi:hypothetical protein